MHGSVELARVARRVDLDWLRVGAFGLLIFYHVGMAFVTWDWHVKTAHPSHTIEPAMILLNPWRLGLLFLVSGAATRFMADRMKPGALWRRRLARLGPPLLFGMFVVVPPQSWVQVTEHGYRLGFWAFYGRYITAYGGFCDKGGCLIVPTWNHLWFVAYLLAYTSLLLGVASLAGPWWGRMSGGASACLAGSRSLAWPAAWLMLVRTVVHPQFPETHALVNDWAAHAEYFPLFLLGYWQAHEAGFWSALTRRRYVALAAGITAYGAMMWVDQVAYPGDMEAPDWVLFVYRSIYGLDQWAWMAAALGFAHRYLHRPSRVLTYLTQGVFPFYIVHQSIIVVMEFWLKRFGLPAWQEGLWLILATVAGCFATYETVRRVGALRPLFGLRTNG